MTDLLLFSSTMSAALFWLATFEAVSGGDWFVAVITGVIAAMWTVPATLVLIGVAFGVRDRLIRGPRP